MIHRHSPHLLAIPIPRLSITHWLDHLSIPQWTEGQRDLDLFVSVHGSSSGYGQCDPFRKTYVPSTRSIPLSHSTAGVIKIHHSSSPFSGADWPVQPVIHSFPVVHSWGILVRPSSYISSPPGTLWFTACC